MICIFSSPVDISTTDVIKWLNHLGVKDVIRINYDDDEDEILIDAFENNFYFQVNKKTIRLEDIKAVWYRKGKHWLSDQYYSVTIEGHKKFTTHLNNRLNNEAAKLSEYLHFIIENTVPILGSSVKSDLNKLLVLRAAKEVGLPIPDFYISNHKEGIKRILNHSPDLITKAMSDGLYLFDKTENQLGYFTYTEKINEEEINVLPAKISPTLFQKNIIKKYELRVFFLEDTCYSMAILSQTDEKTKIDFRKYNEEKPNRCVPFNLPVDIDKKVKNLFNKLQLNTGSVDFIVDQNGNFYFLEINPVGQFGMVSYPCNYFLERKVALYLNSYATKKRTN